MVTWDEKIAITLSLRIRVIVFLYVIIDNDLLCRMSMIAPLFANEHNWIRYWNIGISYALQIECPITLEIFQVFTAL